FSPVWERGSGVLAFARGTRRPTLYIGARRVGRPSRRFRGVSFCCFWSLAYLGVRCLLQVVLLRRRSEEFRELEIVVLRHELSVLGPGRRAHILATSLTASSRTQIGRSRVHSGGGIWTDINDYVPVRCQNSGWALTTFRFAGGTE